MVIGAFIFMKNLTKAQLIKIIKFCYEQTYCLDTYDRFAYENAVNNVNKIAAEVLDKPTDGLGVYGLKEVLNEEP